MKLPVWPSGKHHIIDEVGADVGTIKNTKTRDYIIKATNSHEKYKIAIAKAYEGLCINDPDACDEAIRLIDEVTKEAEKK